MTVPQFFDKILDLLFPNVCGICNKICRKSICLECTKEVEKYKYVQKRNKFSNLESKLESKIYFDEQIYFYKYEGLIRKKIIEYKFEDKPYLYKMFSQMIYTSELVNFCKNYDIIMPVPIDKKRMINRGYNQTSLIANELTNRINIKIENRVLYKIKNIKPQSTMTCKQDRMDNIKGAFGIKRKEYIEGKNILIFDDIFTTGSTANECAKILKQNGIEKVGIVTIAKD